MPDNEDEDVERGLSKRRRSRSEREKGEQGSKDTKGDKDTMQTQESKEDKGAWDVDNINKSDKWSSKLFHLPDDLREEFEAEWRRAQYLVGDDIELDRHFKPLVVKVALGQLADYDDEAYEAALADLVDKQD